MDGSDNMTDRNSVNLTFAGLSPKFFPVEIAFYSPKIRGQKGQYPKLGKNLVTVQRLQLIEAFYLEQLS